MQRWFLILSIVVVTVCSADCHARSYRRYGRGRGGGGGVGTAYSADVRAQAALAVAQGAASLNYAKANQANALARSKYIDNQEKFIDMRRRLRAASEADQEQQKAEAKARAALRPAPASLAQVYPRLSADQLDPLTGQIHWPASLMASEFSTDRKTIETALQAKSQYGASDRTSKILNEAAHRMIKTLSGDYAKVGTENYSSDRRFLNSLSVEGDHAMESLK